MDDTIRRLKELTDSSDNIVFFGGAGVSTESGIPDFRSVDGLYHQKFRYPPETMLSHTFYETHTEEFYDFYRAKMLALDAQPNAAHRKLAEWERQGKLKAVITQNIDGLHQKAGSRKVLELHGFFSRSLFLFSVFREILSRFRFLSSVFREKCLYLIYEHASRQKTDQGNEEQSYT